MIKLPVQCISQYVCIVWIILLAWNVNMYCCWVSDKSSARFIYWGNKIFRAILYFVLHYVCHISPYLDVYFSASVRNSHMNYSNWNWWAFEASMCVCTNLCIKIFLIFTCLCKIVVSLVITYVLLLHKTTKSHIAFNTVIHEIFYNFSHFTGANSATLHMALCTELISFIWTVDFHNTYVDFVPLTWTVMRSSVWFWSSKF